MMMAAETITKPCLNDIEVHKTESVASASSSSASSDSSLSTASGKALLALSKTELDRLIAENMTSVLKALKKRKHAKKHARLRQAAASAEEATHEASDRKEEQESNRTSVQTEEKMDCKEKKESHDSKKGRGRPKGSRKNGAHGTSESKTKDPSARLKEVQPDTKHDSAEGATPPPTSGMPNGQPVEKTGKENKTVNAFQLMMKARSKCIGSNSPGKEREVSELSPTEELAREKKAVRSLQLQQWAAQKGAGKRRIQEEAEEDFIEHQMKQRAKRLKKLIGNMNGEKANATETTRVVEEKEAIDDVLVILDSPIKRTVEQRKENPKSSPKDDASVEKAPKTNGEVKPSGRKSRGRPRKSVVEETIEQEKANDASDEEFLVQLSSPRKKKDSLLGYFAKLTPETKKQQHDSTPTGKASKTPSSQNTTPVVTVLVDEDSKQTASTPPPPSQTSSSRPRRSCANRIKDYSAFEKYSPAKEEEKPTAGKKPPIVTPLKIINVQSPNAMKVVKSPSLRMFSSGGTAEAGKTIPPTEWPSTPKSVKLAPVFARKMMGGKTQPPQEDPEKVRARQLFLMSGIPEKMRQEREKRAIYEDFVLNESPVFPLVSHVMQMEEKMRPSKPTKINFSESCIKMRPVEVESSPGKSTSKGVKIRFGMFTSCSEYDFEEALEKCAQPIVVDGKEVDEGGSAEHEELPEVQNVKEIVRDYKQRFPHFPVFRCYKQFRAIYQDHQQRTRDDEMQPEQGDKPNGTHWPVDESLEILEPKFSCRNGELLFTEKYKPQNTEQILINFSPANMLTQFLALWQDEAGSQKRSNEISTQSGHYFMSTEKDDEADFLLSNDSNSSSTNGPGANVCNHVVLVGPPGCGKTSNVYAVANEMNFNVLEINASSRRKGKIILQELLEATQSHQVRQKTERSNSTDGLLINGRQKGSGRGKNGLSGVFRCLERRPSFSEANGNGSKKLSLILIEDADIVFEQDDGFLAAINQLIATSKRPIVLTTTNPSCAHMARYMARNNVIRYVAPGIGNVSKFLSLLALVERIPIDQHDLGRLYAYNGKDMRKTLNELQFFIQSGGDMERFPSTSVRSDMPDEDGEDLNTALNETREEEHDGEQEMMGGEHHLSGRKNGRKKGAKSGSKKQHPHHGTLYELFTRNQNESILLRIPLDFNVLWCNMDLVFRAAAMIPTHTGGVQSDKRKRNSSAGNRAAKRGSIGRNETAKAPDVLECEELAWMYENISHAEAGWGVTQKNRIRYGKDVQDEQQQQQLANELGHALVEGSWIEWFSRGTDHPGSSSETIGARKTARGEKGIDAKAYDALRKLEQEPRQTISSYIGVNGIRSRVTACDYEPLLRQICRHERDRFLTERRGSRFYHYLRNFTAGNGTTPQQLVSSSSTQMMSGGTGLTGFKPAGGFSVDHLDALSHCFEEQQELTDSGAD